MRKSSLVILLFCHLIGITSADPSTVSYHSSVDWQLGSLVIDITVTLGTSESLAFARTKAEELAEREIGGIFYEVISRMVYDSYRSVADISRGNPDVLASLFSIGTDKKPEKIHLNANLDTVIVRYTYDLFPTIMKVFTNHQVANEPEKVLSYVPSLDYTGIVIFAKGEYPIHGENNGKERYAGLTPSLRPRIYDDNMRLVAAPEMIDPVALTMWGVVAYTDSTDITKNSHRIGPFPLLTMARAVFGDNRTDLLIPEDSALKILSNANNRELIRQGRILIIW